MTRPGCSTLATQTRIMTVSLGLGSRLPAYATSMGRVLLADLAPDDLEAHLAATTLVPLTTRTTTRPDLLRDEVERVRCQGWALVDQELEDGVRSIAAPLRDARGRAIAAVNISGHAGRTSLTTMREQFLPDLLAAAGRISSLLARR
jgi:IclR family pca regulon transcriptional regulator